jgi:3-phosphoshikimate 1-carboxyvinyltransferase
MSNKLIINGIINSFNKTIAIEGDKSLSIRWALLASQANGKSTATNLLKSDDVLSTLSCLKKLGIKIKLSHGKCEIFGAGINGYKYKKNITLNAGNSGTLARLISGLLIHTTEKIKITGDKSLSKRDFLRISEPLKKFGAKIQTTLGVYL